MTVRARTTRATVLGLSLALVACGTKDAHPLVGVDTNRAVDTRKARATENPVTGYLITSVGARTIGPFFARRGAGLAGAGLVAWVTGAEGATRRILVVPVGANGAPRGSETVAANVSVDTTMLVVRPLRGSSPGFLLVWSALTERGKSLWSVAVGDNGVPRSKPVELTRTNDDVVWVDVVPTEHGALCVWAEETRENDANLVAAAIDSEGKIRGVPTRVARGVVGWHALELPTGVGLSTVTAPPGAAKSQPAGKLAEASLREARTGALSFHRLDADGHEATAPTLLTTKPVGDVEVVRDGSRVVFGWTDRSATEPTILMATLDEKNVIGPPREVVDARGGAVLLGLVSGPTGIGVLFESPARRRGESRHIHAAHVGAGLVVDHRPLSIDAFSQAAPELAATPSGFAVVATTRDCEDRPPSCMSESPVATVFRTDGKGELVQREALTFQTDPATLGWGLSCDGENCFTLAVSSDAAPTPSRIRTAAIRFRTNRTARTPTPTAPTPDEPRVADIVAIASGESVIDIASASSGKGNLVAMLTDRRAERGRLSRNSGALDEPKSTPVTLSTRLLDENGTTVSSSVISTRALHIGGIAIANTDKPEDGSAIAWVARDNGDPEVHVTRLDKQGRRKNDVQLTTTKGDAANVTLTWVGDGWIVAWVDSRNGNGEVYATKVSRDLGHTREERITNAPGDASDLVALAHGDAVWLAWADPRESARDGNADVFVSAVRKQDAKRSLDEQRVLPTAAHSRSPRLATDGKGIHVAWIEEAPPGAATPNSSGYGAFWAKLDANGKTIDRPARLTLAGDGAASAVALESGDRLRAVVARSTPESISLDAIELSPAGRPASLLTLDGPPSLDVALALDGDLLFFNDDGTQPQDRRARRARITWPRHDP